MLDTCCEDLHLVLIEEMNDDPAYRDHVLRQCDAEGYMGKRLRRVADVDQQFLLDWHPDIRPIEQREAKAFVDQHHAHNKAPVGWRYGAGIWNGAQLIGVVMVGRPVARAIDATKVVEVNRLCVRRDIPAAFVWNACSLAYGWAAREAKARGYRKVITYTLESEAGTALKAVGWTPEAKTKGGSWNTPSRSRRDAAPTCRKVRWVREFKEAA